VCCLHEEYLKLARVAALDKEGVGIVALGQEDAASGNTLDASRRWANCSAACWPLRLSSTSKVR
jgi:hypothetical protein